MEYLIEGLSNESLSKIHGGCSGVFCEPFDCVPHVDNCVSHCGGVACGKLNCGSYST